MDQLKISALTLTLNTSFQMIIHTKSMISEEVISERHRMETTHSTYFRKMENHFHKQKCQYTFSFQNSMRNHIWKKKHSS